MGDLHFGHLNRRFDSDCVALGTLKSVDLNTLDAWFKYYCKLQMTASHYDSRLCAHSA